MSAQASGEVPRGHKRALTGLRGGPIDRLGDARIAAVCAEALDVVDDGAPQPLTHGFHSYPARFHPELPRRLLAAFPDARRVLDPFAGSGTTLVEAALAGRAGLGTDVNTLAVMLARLKATPTSEAQRRLLSERSETIAERAIAEGKAARRTSAREAPRTTRATPPRFDDPSMYLPHVYRELCTLRLTIDELAPAGGPDRWLRDALLLVLSSIVVKMSLQRSDTDPRRVERHIGRGAAARLYLARATLLGEQLAAFDALVPLGTPAPDVRRSDARRLRHIESGTIDLVITSPPYLGTYDYAAHHERRFGWLGLDERAMALLRKSELGARRDAGNDAATLARWHADVEAFVGEIARALRPGGFAFLLVGDSVVGQRAIAGDAALKGAAKAHGLALVASASQGRPEVRATERQGEREPVERREHLVALRRGA